MYWITGFLGFSLAVSPFLFSYSDSLVATVVSVSLGILIVCISYLERIARTGEKWEYIVAELLGFTVVATPFVFQFDQIVSALWMSIGVGILLMVISSSKIYLDSWEY